MGVIRIDGETQPRAELNQDVIADYAQQMNNGDRFPSIVVFHDGSDYWLADGFHRYHAAKKNEYQVIKSDVKQGTRRDATLYSLGANNSHGLRRTNTDKKRVIETCLKDAEWSKWSNREIARHCAVDEISVRRYRDALSATLSQIERHVERNGTTYTMNTSNIGQRPSEISNTPVNKSFPDFEQWQKDNVSLGLDEFGDVPPMTVPFTEELDDDSWSDDISSIQPEAKPAPVYVPILEPVMPTKSNTLTALQSCESNEWFTPAQYVDAARELMRGIDIDPASNATANEVIKATMYYGIDSNGFDKPWHGRVWLNPPYGRDLAGSNQDAWSRRLLGQYKAGVTTEAILLVNANTEAKWFQPLYDYLICLTNHRIKFYTTDGTSSQPTQGNALIYLGTQQERFVQIFKQFGRIVKAVD